MKFIISLLLLASCAHPTHAVIPDPLIDGDLRAASRDNSIWVSNFSERESVKQKTYVEQPILLTIDASTCPAKANDPIEIGELQEWTDSVPVVEPAIRLVPSDGIASFTFRTQTYYLPTELYLICPAMKTQHISPENCFGTVSLPKMRSGVQPTRQIEVKYSGKECAFKAE